MRKKPTIREYIQIDMMLETTTNKREEYSFDMGSLIGDFKLNMDVSKVEKEILLSLKNL